MQEFKKVHGCRTTTLIILDEEINGIIKTASPLKDSNILLKIITKTIEKEKRTKMRIFENTIGTLGASLLGNMLKRKRILAEGAGFGNKDRKEI